MLNLLLAKETTVGAALELIRGQVELELPTTDSAGQPLPIERSVRMLELFGHRIFKVISYADPIDTINDQYWTIRAEVCRLRCPCGGCACTCVRWAVRSGRGDGGRAS